MKYYVVDAFTRKVFKGNPAGVCILDRPLDEAAMQKIAFENNLSQTAFVYEKGGVFTLRWFSPKVEITLCGHATLAAAHVLMSFVNTALSIVQFQTKSGPITVMREGRVYKMDFPRMIVMPCPVHPLLEQALGVKVLETYLARHLMVVLEDETAVRAVVPNLATLTELTPAISVIVTARSDNPEFDIVSRVFSPSIGISEDPVSGSSHTMLIPFWAEKLGKRQLVSVQLSERGGILYCRDMAARVEIGGEAVCYLSGSLLI